MSDGTDLDELFEPPPSTPGDSGGEPSSSDGSAGRPGTEGAGATDELTCPECGRSDFKSKAGLGTHRFSSHGVAGSHSERRPKATGAKRKRRLLPARAPKPAGDTPPPPASPRGRRVSTAPLTSSLVAFAAGGLDRIGQTPLAQFTAFTSPVAGEIVDEAVAGSVVDRLVQPIVRGSEKYQNLSALFAGYAAVAWASNAPEATEQAYALYHWSMTILLPLAGKEMVKQAKAQRKAAEELAEILPELRELGLGDDPIRGMWDLMWKAPPRPRHAAPEGADVPA